MTSFTSLHTHSATTPPPDSRQKDMLFCPACGHESPISGDWVTEQHADGRTIRCPACRTVVSNR